MTLALARVLAARGTYDREAAFAAYCDWLDSAPFDVGNTVGPALRGRPNPESQANGALMRISPLGIFGARHDSEKVAAWARQHSGLTHPNHVCLRANELFACAIAYAVRSGPRPHELYDFIVARAEAGETAAPLMQAVRLAAESAVEDCTTQAGWVLIALQNALWQLLHAATLEEAVIDSVMRGGDTDTNAAICGALLGAVSGAEALPQRWVQTILGCRAERGSAGVRRPRPQI